MFVILRSYRMYEIIFEKKIKMVILVRIVIINCLISEVGERLRKHLKNNLKKWVPVTTVTNS